MEPQFPKELFAKISKDQIMEGMNRPSLSYWQDATRRFLKNKQSVTALVLSFVLLTFSFIGPLLWTKDPARQDISNPAVNPNWSQTAVIVEDELSWKPRPVSEDQLGVKKENATPLEASKLQAPSHLKVIGTPNTFRVLLEWEPVIGASSYVIYRSEILPFGESLGLPVGEVENPFEVGFADEQALEARSYYYSVVPRDEKNEESDKYVQTKVDVVTGIRLSDAREKDADVGLGDVIDLGASPLGTDALGRDLLARLMAGGRVSLLIGILASFLSVVIGIILGGLAGFFGGKTDTLLMQFTDLVTGLPFLLFMILLKVILSSGPGESGATALLISLVILSWTGTARLVRGQILQIRESEFVQSARLMGARPFYLIYRHLLPNLIGVILVTLTFQIPSAIFTEAFLSFIGLGVTSPSTSWGSLCNDALQSLLTRPHEFFAPAFVISLTVLSFNLLGDGLRDALDPKLRSNE